MDIKKRYRNRFVLDEGKLRKIAATIAAFQLPAEHSWRPSFEAIRHDGTEHRFSSLDDVFADTNSGRRAIRKIRLEYRCQRDDGRYPDSELPRCTVVFDAEFSSWGDTVTAELVNMEKVPALLLADELDLQISRALQPARPIVATFGETFDWLLPGLILAAIVMVIGLRTESAPSPPPWINLSTEEKLNQLLVYASRDKLLGRSPLFLLGAAGAIVLISVVVVGAFAGLRVFGRLAERLAFSCFYWGDQMVPHDRHVRLVSNIGWVVVTGFLVSLIAGVIVAVAMR